MIFDLLEPRKGISDMVRLACFFQVGALLVLAVLTWSRIPKPDLRVYRATCEGLGRGEHPYTDFPLEYPPAAALIFAGPRLLGAFHWHGERFYRMAFTFQNALLAAAGTPAVISLSRRIGIPDRIAIWRYSVLLLVLFAFVMWRFDIFTTLTTLLALMCLMSDRSLAAGLWLGVAVAVKLYPVVLLPVFVGYQLCRRRITAAARVGIASLAPGVLSLAPWLVHHSTAFLSFARYHIQRGIQWESLPAGCIMLATRFKWITATITDEYGARDVYSPWNGFFLKWQPTVMAISLLAMLALTGYRMRRDLKTAKDVRVSTMAASVTALLLIFIVTNKVFSPQYVLWIAPFAALLRPRLWWGVLLICLMTAALYLKGYPRLLALQTDAVLFLNLRNALTAALILAIAMDRSPGAAGRKD